MHVHIGAMDSAPWNRESGLFRIEDQGKTCESHSSETPGALSAAALELGIPSLERLKELLVSDPAEAWRRVPGRMTFPVGVDAAGAPVAVAKRFEGDLPRDRWYEILRGRKRGPAQREYENLVGMARAGIAAPRALGWAATPSASILLMEYVPHQETALDRLEAADAAERQGLVDRVMQLTARLHQQGWYHRDLYLQHFALRRGDGALVLLDLGRARRQARPRARWFHKDLGALLHSCPASLSPSERLRGLVLYADRSSVVGRVQRRRLLREAMRFQRRIAGHAPRY